MRRKWPVAAAAIPLAFGWALLAAHPAAASTRTSSVLPLTNFGSVSFTGVTANGKSLDTLDPVQISMPDTSVADMASDGSFSVNYTGTGFAQWFGV